MAHELAGHDACPRSKLRGLRSAVPLAAAVVALAACEQVGESTLEVENQTSQDLSVTAVGPSVAELTVPVPKGQIVTIFHDADTPTPPPPETLSTLSADITVDGQPVQVYTQDPVDSQLWQRLVWPTQCYVAECARYVLILTDDDLTLP